MRRPAIVAVTAVAAVTVGAAPAVPATASAPKVPDRFGSHRTLSVSDLATKPLALQPDRQVSVIVRVSGTTVAAAKAAGLAKGRTLSRAQAAKVRATGRAAQAPVVAEIRARGGKVSRQLADAVNAVTARVRVRDVAALRAVPGVVAVDPVHTVTRSNLRSDLYTGAAAAWSSYGVDGSGVKVAVIDTGIDYTHATFGGAGTTAAFEANDGAVVEPGSFPTAKVVGGYDFVGDDYNYSGGSATPAPDADPLDCNGHGSHVAGTAAGFGVNADGSTYTGAYTSAAVQAAGLRIGPGSAPKASLMGYRVFGCDGDVSNDIVIAAIDRAVADGADVINMSLGGSYGRASDVDAVTVDNAAKAGVMMVISAGNDGQAPYIVGGPSTADRALSVAAMDANESFGGADIAVGSTHVTAINANAGPLPVNATLDVITDPTQANGISLGCDAADYAGTAGKVVVVSRGTCARVDRATLGDAAGAAAVIMVNNDAGLPPFEGDIAGVDIPFLGVGQGDGATLLALDGETADITGIAIANPTFAQPIGFTSGGPRSGDAGVKPDVSAPGVSIFSAAVGTGSGGIVESGTSMAAPHTAGIAALVAQKHPSWSPNLVKAALVNTATSDPAKLSTNIRVAGNGLVQPEAALATSLLMYSGGGETGVSFGVQELDGGFVGTDTLTLRNTGNRPVRVALSTAFEGDARGASMSVWPSSVVVPPGTRKVLVTLKMSKAAVAALPQAGTTAEGIVVVKGRVVGVPSNGGPTISAPVQVVPYGRSDIEAERGNGSVKIKNEGRHVGDADFYEWIGSDARERGSFADLRALGAQSFDLGSDHLVVFAVNDWNKFSNPAEIEYDLYVDSDGDGSADHVLVAVDAGLLLSGAPDGTLGAFAIDLATNDVAVLNGVGTVDGSTVLIPAFAADLGITAASGPVTVSLENSSIVSGLPVDAMADASFDVFDPQRSTGDFVSLGSRERATVPVTSRPAASGEPVSPGWMVVTLDDHSGAEQADLVRASGRR